MQIVSRGTIQFHSASKAANRYSKFGTFNQGKKPGATHSCGEKPWMPE